MPIATLSHESVTCVMKTAAKRWSEFAVELSTRVSGSSANTIATSRSATARRTATRARALPKTRRRPASSRRFAFPVVSSSATPAASRSSIMAAGVGRQRWLPVRIG